MLRGGAMIISVRIILHTYRYYCEVHYEDVLYSENQRDIQRHSLNPYSGPVATSNPLKSTLLPLEKSVNKSYTESMKKSELIKLATPFYEENEILELDHAIDVASKAHKGQKRKSGEPYIIHPLSVASTLVEWDMDIDTVLAGVLHDTVEDTDMILEKIESLFGNDVAILVDGVTKVSQAPAGMQDLTDYLPQTKG